MATQTSRDSNPKERPSVVVFRCDDYGVADGLIEQVEHHLVNLFVRNDLKLVFSVIPENLHTRPDKIKLLKPFVASGKVEIVLHGWDHKPLPDLLASRGWKSEFIGRSYEEQLGRISRGKHLLEELFEQPVQCFVPPWNNYDLTTLRACAELGLKVVSANIYAPANKENLPLVLLPSTATLHTLERMVLAWPGQARPGRVAVVYFHAYEFYESGSELASYSLEKLGTLLDRLAHSANITTLSLSEAARRLGPELTDRRYVMAQQVDRSAAAIYQSRWRTRIGNLFHILTPLEASGYETSAFYAQQQAKQWALYHLLPITFILAILSALVILWMPVFQNSRRKIPPTSPVSGSTNGGRVAEPV